jgi:hypothetical protein
MPCLLQSGIFNYMPPAYTLQEFESVIIVDALHLGKGEDMVDQKARARYIRFDPVFGFLP